MAADANKPDDQRSLCRPKICQSRIQNQVTTYNQDGKAVQLQKAKLAVTGKALVEQHISIST
jgi:hypothetical protein